METEKLLVEISEEQAGIRLDKALAMIYQDKSRSRIQQLIKNGDVLVNGELMKASYEVNVADLITLVITNETLNVQPQNIPLDIVYEDDNLLVINKSQGMVVHPSIGHLQGTLVNALLFHCQNLSGINGVLRPGIVHRLDKDTSGLMIVTKDDYTHNHIAQQLKDKTLERYYLSLVHNVILNDNGIIKTLIGRSPYERLKMAVVMTNGKEALTTFKVLSRYNRHCLVECKLGTGRTHQIRVHMSYINHPVVGDPLYGGKSSLHTKGQLLHSYKLSFFHPVKQKLMNFEIPLPKYFLKIIEGLE